MNILITGGASGLGQAITQKLASETTNKIFFTYNESAQNAKGIETEFTNTTGIQCNFAVPSDIETLQNHINDLDLDVLINNALTGLTQNHFDKIAPETFLDSFQNNVIPTLQISQTVLRLFKKKRHGRIITILTSYLLNTPPTGLSEYVANKSYLLSMSKSWATEYAKYNISANCISPSFMQTGLTEDTDERVIEMMAQKHPLKKLITPAEVADTVMFMCSATQHLNGANIVLNGAENVV